MRPGFDGGKKGEDLDDLPEKRKEEDEPFSLSKKSTPL